MFWRKKSTVDSSKCPSIDNIDGFVEWLLRYGEDFDAYRVGAQASMGRYMKSQTANVTEALATTPDEASLSDHLAAGLDDYMTNYNTLVETSGNFQNLPTHVHARAFPLIVKLRVMMYVLQHRYQQTPSDGLLSLLGPLKAI